MSLTYNKSSTPHFLCQIDFLRNEKHPIYRKLLYHLECKHDTNHYSLHIYIFYTKTLQFINPNNPDTKKRILLLILFEIFFLALIRTIV